MNIQPVDIGHPFVCVCAGCGRIIGATGHTKEKRWADLDAEAGTYYCGACKSKAEDSP